MKIKRSISLVILLLIIMSFSRNKIWHDEFTLWLDVVRKTPENWRALYNLALEFHKKGKSDEALFYLKKIIDSGGHKWYVYSKIGSILAERGLYEESLLWHTRALSIAEEKQKAAVYNSIGVTYFKKGDYKGAEKAFTKAISIDAQHAEAYYNLGVIYWYENKIDRAIEFFNKAIQKKPLYFDAYYNLGIIYGNMGELDRAIEFFSEAISIRETAEAYIKRSLAYRLKGQIDRAEKDILRARSLELNAENR